MRRFEEEDEAIADVELRLGMSSIQVSVLRVSSLINTLLAGIPLNYERLKPMSFLLLSGCIVFISTRRLNDDLA